MSGAGSDGRTRRAFLVLFVAAVVGIGWMAFRERTRGERPDSSGTRRPGATTGVGDSEGVAEDEPRAARWPAPVDLNGVDRARDLHGIVVRKSDGAPIGGAEVVVVRYPWRRAFLLDADRHYNSEAGERTTSAHDGTFSLRLRPGERVAVRVHAEGYATCELSKRQPGERLRVEMVPGVRLTVVVQDERGGAVPRTRIRLSSRDGNGPEPGGETDEEGRCRFEALFAPAAYTMAVIPPRLGQPGLLTVLVPESGDHEEIVTLTEGRTLRGRVTDADTGEPVADARVGVNWVMRHWVATDDRGDYRLPGWTGKGVSDVHCVADGYGRAQWTVDGDHHDFELSRGDRITGRLVGTDGRPVVGALLHSIGSKRVDDGQQICARGGASGPDGRFLLSGLRRDMPHTLIVLASGYGRYLLDFDPAPDGPATIDLGDIVLPAGRTIGGRVLSHAGEPAARIEVFVSGHNADRGRLRNDSILKAGHYGRAESRYTDDLGRFRFADLSPGRYTLRAAHPGAPDATLDVTLSAENDLPDTEIVLPAGRRFTVTVVDEEGEPIPGAFVTVHSSAIGRNARTDLAGEATFLVEGTVRRIQTYPTGPKRNVLLRGDDRLEEGGDSNAYRVVLRLAATITGIVRDTDGQPLADALLVALLGKRQLGAARTGKDGRFSIKVPHGDPVDLKFAGAGKRAGAVHLERRGRIDGVRPGATGIVLRLEAIAKDRSLRVRLVDPDGAPVANVTVFAGNQRKKTDSEGVAEFSALLARKTSVSSLVPPDRPDVIWPEPISLIPAGQEVTLTLRAASTITGIVLLPDGSPAKGVPVQALVKRRIRYGVVTDEFGRFTLSIAATEPGPWTIHAEVRGTKLRGQRERVATGATDVRIQLAE